MAGKAREQALPLLAAANNHGDLAVKLSSLKQVKDILVSAEPALAADLFPYLVELQSSPETLVRKYLLEVIEEIGVNGLEQSSILMPVLLALLKDDSSIVVKQAIVTGTNIFCIVLEELSLQFQRRGIVERWLEELWTWMARFKDAVLGVLFEGGTVGPKLLAVKFLETYVLLFTADASDSDKSLAEAITRPGRAFNISWLAGHHPVLDPGVLTADAYRTFTFMLDLLRSASSLPGLLTISVVNSLATIARKRPAHYGTVLSALLEINSNFEISKGGHTASIQYSVRTALLGFLRCIHPTIMESRERLLKALRAMNAGDAADQVIRQVEKMMRNNERASRDARSIKDEQPSNHFPVSGDLVKKRPAPMDNEDVDTASKRTRYGPDNHAAPPIETNDSGQDNVNGVSPKASLLDSELTPVEQMIAMIGALIAEGERGVESLEILISKIHPDLLADIVITNMKHLPRNPPPLAKVSNLSSNQHSDSSGPAQVVGSVSSLTSVQIPVTSAQITVSSSLSDMSTSINQTSDSKRDPRRDPRRLDPRRAAVPVGVPPDSIAEDNTTAMQSGSLQPEAEVPNPSNKPFSDPMVFSSENMLEPVVPKTESNTKFVESLVTSRADLPATAEEIQEEEIEEIVPDMEVREASDISIPSISKVEESRVEEMTTDTVVIEEVYSPSLEETDQLSPAIYNVAASEDASVDLPMLPAYVELTEEQQRNVGKLAVERIIDSDKNLQGTECKQTRMALLARLVTQIVDDDGVDVVMMMQKHIISDYQQQKGHDHVMHVLYHLHSLMVSDSVEISPSPAAVYEKFLLGVAKALLDTLPATDKSFSRLLGEVPWLPDSVMRLLDNICSKYHAVKDGRESDRVTQGLGAVWSLILARPLDRQACLDIALKCAIHSQDDIRAKAIRLVANKLYVLNYISENIERFATNMFLSAVDQHVSDTELSQSGLNEQRMEREVGSQETSISGSQISESAVSETECVKGAQLDSQTDSSVSFARAQSLISLFFALCTKKPSLLQLVFETYGRAPKSVKQAVHRHIPVLIRALGSSYSELLRIISDPPIGSENLLTQVLRILSEETATPSDLIATVKRLYETKLKDATILIPVLSSFSKSEVLPIFPRLVDLPLDKFQMALAHILQGSAHTGPALTPAEVLVAIHDINPERDGLPLKKITDACSACFEQRTVFTQQVLAKALNQMVDQTPLPLLFMRTVIQAIDAFPTLVDFVMEILSKLVSRQVWRMPKLWVGFLKCVSQTQPHSFRVLLQLPPAQLESALNKYASLRGPLAGFANQPNVKNALPRSTLSVLLLANESHLPQQHASSSLHTADTSSSVHGATLT